VQTCALPIWTRESSQRPCSSRLPRARARSRPRSSRRVYPGPTPWLRGLEDRVEAALFDRTVAKRSAQRLVQVGRGGPADVAAAGALAGVVARGARLGGAGRA